MKSIAREIEGLQKMRVADLVTRYEEVFGKPPRIKHRQWLWKRIAWKIQERRYGGLSEVAKRRLEELISEIDLPIKQKTVTAPHRGPRNGQDPPVGTTIVRTWKGRDIRVQVAESGYEWDGVVYRSLSAVAKAVTGSHWNGRLFFGLTERKKR